MTQEAYSGQVGYWAQHRDKTRSWVAVLDADEEPDVVYVVEDQNYDFSGLRDVFASLYAALVAYPCSWRLEPDDGRWIREDGDAAAQTAMSITRVAVQRPSLAQ